VLLITKVLQFTKNKSAIKGAFLPAKSTHSSSLKFRFTALLLAEKPPENINWMVILKNVSLWDQLWKFLIHCHFCSIQNRSFLILSSVNLGIASGFKKVKYPKAVLLRN